MMGEYLAGNPVTLWEQFVDEDGVPFAPAAVAFKVRDPRGVLTTYTLGVDPEVSAEINNIPDSRYFGSATGFYICQLGPLTGPAGLWHYSPQGHGPDGYAAVSDYDFTLIASSTEDPEVAPPAFGPCQLWCDVNDVAALAGMYGSDAFIFEPYVAEASQLLFELGGRQHSGICETDVPVRPCRNAGCGAWGAVVAQGVNPLWWWGNYPFGGNIYGWWPGGEGGAGLCGCGGLSRVKLSGYPVTEIVSVTISGVDIPELDDDDDPNWRLDNYRWLTRMWKPNASDPQNPTARMWPACQNLALAPDQPGTFAIRYRYGQAPPLAGIAAAVELAYQLYVAATGGDCVLPTGATKVERQGVTISRALFLAWGRVASGAGSDPVWSTGLTQVDAYLNAYNKAGQRRRSVVWSPDVQQFAKKLGQ